MILLNEPNSTYWLTTKREELADVFSAQVTFRLARVGFRVDVWVEMYPVNDDMRKVGPTSCEII